MAQTAKVYDMPGLTGPTTLKIDGTSYATTDPDSIGEYVASIPDAVSGTFGAAHLDGARVSANGPIVLTGVADSIAIVGASAGGLTQSEGDKIAAIYTATQKVPILLAEDRKQVDRTMEIKRGDDYTVGSPRGPFEWPIDPGTDLAGATVVFTCKDTRTLATVFTVNGTVEDAGLENQRILAPIPQATTEKLNPDSYNFDVQITLSGKRWSPDIIDPEGCTVVRDYTANS